MTGQEAQKQRVLKTYKHKWIYVERSALEIWAKDFPEMKLPRAQMKVWRVVKKENSCEHKKMVRRTQVSLILQHGQRQAIIPNYSKATWSIAEKFFTAKQKFAVQVLNDAHTQLQKQTVRGPGCGSRCKAVEPLFLLITSVPLHKTKLINWFSNLLRALRCTQNICKSQKMPESSCDNTNKKTRALMFLRFRSMNKLQKTLQSRVARPSRVDRACQPGSYTKSLAPGGKI